MSALVFDTHKAVTALKQAGSDEGRAEAVVNTVSEALSGNVVTKADLTEAVAAVRADPSSGAENPVATEVVTEPKQDDEATAEY